MVDLGMQEPGVPGMQLAPPIFGRSVNPIPTRGGQNIPTYYYWPPPKVFHLPASLNPIMYVKGPYLFWERQFVFWRVKLLSKQIEAKTLGHNLQNFNQIETK